MKQLIALSLVVVVLGCQSPSDRSFEVANDIPGLATVETGYQDFQVANKPEISAPLKATVGSDSIEVVAIAKINEDGLTAWDPQGKKSESYSDKLRKAFRIDGEPSSPQGQRMPLTVSIVPDRINRLAILKFSDPSHYDVINGGNRMGYGVFRGQEQLVHIIAKTGEKTGTARILDSNTKPEEFTIPLTGAANVKDSTGKILLTKIKTLDKGTDLSDSGGTDVYINLPGPFVNGYTAYLLKLPSDWNDSKFDAHLVDASGQQLTSVGPTGELETEAGASSNDNPFKTRVFASRKNLPGMDCNAVLQVPTNNVKKATKIVVTVQPRKLIEITGIPLFPK